VIGDTVLREVLGADLFRSVTGLDLPAGVRRRVRLAVFPFHFIKPASEERRGQIKTGDRSEKIAPTTSRRTCHRITASVLRFTTHRRDGRQTRCTGRRLSGHYEPNASNKNSPKPDDIRRWHTETGHRATPRRERWSYTLAAELLLLHATGRTRTLLYSHPEDELSESESQKLCFTAERRAAGVPVQHLTGKQEFWGLDSKSR